MNPTLFELEALAIETKKELTIRKDGKAILSKDQKEFNRLVKKIEQLRALGDRINADLDQKVAFYVAKMVPIEQKIDAGRAIIVKRIYPFCDRKSKIPSSGRKILKEIIFEFLDDLLTTPPYDSDEELKIIFEQVAGATIEQQQKDSFEESKDDLEFMFRAMGLDIDMSEFHAGMTEQEIMQKMFEFQEKMHMNNDEPDQPPPARKKTKKQIEREEKEKRMEEARNKNVGTIYKQLVKLFHPDLEHDPVERLKKEEIMKQITVAYEKNDLHTLLKLELEWVQKESTDIGKLSNEKLAIYNEASVAAIYHHPRFECLHRFVDYPSQLTSLNLANERRKIENIANTTTGMAGKLHGDDVLGAVKEIIHGYRQALRHRDNLSRW